MKIKKGDTVEVISGNDRGKRGEVLRVNLKDSRVVVQGVNLRKKHQKQKNTGGRRPLSPGIVQFEGPLHLSNVMVVCPNCGEASRVGMRVEDGQRVRVCKNCAMDVDKK